MLDEFYPNGNGDRDSIRTRRSRQHTKDRIAELFFRGATQGNAPWLEVGRGNAIIEYGAGYARFARAPSASAVCCSSSRLPETPEPGE